MPTQEFITTNEDHKSFRSVRDEITVKRQRWIGEVPNGGRGDENTNFVCYSTIGDRVSLNLTYVDENRSHNQRDVFIPKGTRVLVNIPRPTTFIVTEKSFDNLKVLKDELQNRRVFLAQLLHGDDNMVGESFFGGLPSYIKDGKESDTYWVHVPVGTKVKVLVPKP